MALSEFGPVKAWPTPFLFYEDEIGNLWFSKRDSKDISGDGKIYRVDAARPERLTFESFPTDFLWTGGITPLMISDRAGGLWLGQRKWLGRLWQGRFIRVEPTDGLPETDPRCLFLDSRGWLWIGLRYQGVSMTKEPGVEHPTFVNYSTEQGLLSSAVWSIAEDEFGRVYFGTDRGLDQFDPKTNRWRHYTRKDGLASDKITHLYTDRRGHIWVSTFLGVSRFDPRAERTRSHPPPIYVSRVNVAGEDWPLPETGASTIPLIELAASRNNLSIEFVGLHFQGEDNLMYEYQLEGVDANWSAPAKSRTVNYARLSPGTYRFVARAITEDGVPSAMPAVLEFRILPPVYQRWWFLMLAAFSLGVIGYTAYRYRLAQVLELERVRTRIATDLHDDIGSNLSLIAMIGEVAQRHVPADDSQMTDWLSLMASTSRETVDLMSDIVWAVNPQKDSLSDLTQRMRRVAEDNFTARNIAFRFSAPGREMDIKLGAETRREIFKIFKESVHNIVRHAQCTHAAIEFQIEAGWLVLKLSDNGQGFDPILGAYVANGVIGFMWNAAQGGSFPFPHVQWLRFNENNRKLLTQWQIWNSNHAFLYPSVHPNDREHIGGTMAWGGGTFFPGALAWIHDDFNPAGTFSFENLSFAQGNSAPNYNRWGDYFSTRVSVPYGNTWVGTGFVLNGPNGVTRDPRYVWFGRARDTPPPTNTIFVGLGNTSGWEDGSFGHPYNTVTEGHFAAMPGDTILIGPGNDPETLTFSTPVKVDILRLGGTVTIGRR